MTRAMMVPISILMVYCFSVLCLQLRALLEWVRPSLVVPITIVLVTGYGTQRDENGR